MSFHDKGIKEVLGELRSSPDGVTSAEAKTRLAQYGRNVLEEGKKIHPLVILLSQFKSPIVWVLLVALVIAALVGELTDAIVIAAILVINAILGFVQEYRAEEAIAALRKLTALKAKVLRDGKEVLIDAADVVPGDIVLLETGDKVPADGRLEEAHNLHTQESALTGESTPVSKQLKPMKYDAGVADRTDMVFSGTVVTAGRCHAIITGTGHNTEIGKIATLIKEAKPTETPLQKKLAGLSIWLTVFVVVIAVVVFATGVLKGEPLLDFLLAAIALAVAAIPEGLPAIVTTALALGVQRMAKRNALIRKLPSAETLGACTVICTDKTGTLTHNEMTVRKVFVDGKVLSISGAGYSPEGKFDSKTKDLELLLTIGALNNNSKIEQEKEKLKVFGDPTEAALLVSAQKGGLNPGQLALKRKRVDEIEFTSERKLMTTIHQGAKVAAFVKGAPDVVLRHCSKIIVNGKVSKITAKDKKQILSANHAFAKDALRVLGFAYKNVGKERSHSKVEKDLVFVGLQAMIDPPREEAKKAIQECATAGIRVIMITGDHPTTASAIAKELGIQGRMMTGAELEKHPNLAENVRDVGIYARVNPAHKIRIVEALQKQGHVVAMTGDGVNDAPALKKADIGISMGAGTDVAKEASVMVLADNNFASIVSAVREGRRIFDNIGKFLRYLLSANTGEVLTVFLGILFGLPLPILAIHLLWINLVTDGLPALALGIEPPEKNVMRRPPRKVHEQIITKGGLADILLIGGVITAGTLYLFTRYEDLAMARTVAFSTLIVMQMFNVLNKRSQRSIFRTPFFSNPWVLLAIVSSIGLQLLVIYTPLSGFFRTTPLGLIDWAWIVGVSLSSLVMGEIIKLFRGVKSKVPTPQ